MWRSQNQWRLHQRLCPPHCVRCRSTRTARRSVVHWRRNPSPISGSRNQNRRTPSPPGGPMSLRRSRLNVRSTRSRCWPSTRSLLWQRPPRRTSRTRRCESQSAWEPRPACCWPPSCTRAVGSRKSSREAPRARGFRRPHRSAPPSGRPRPSGPPRLRASAPRHPPLPCCSRSAMVSVGERSFGSDPGQPWPVIPGWSSTSAATDCRPWSSPGRMTCMSP